MLQVFELDSFVLLYEESNYNSAGLRTRDYRWAQDSGSMTVLRLHGLWKRADDAGIISAYAGVTCRSLCMRNKAYTNACAYVGDSQASGRSCQIRHDYCKLSAHGEHIIFRTAQASMPHIYVACCVTGSVLFDVRGVSTVPRACMWHTSVDDLFCALSDDCSKVITFSVSCQRAMSVQAVPDRLCQFNQLRLAQWPASGPVIMGWDRKLKASAWHCLMLALELWGLKAGDFNMFTMHDLASGTSMQVEAPRFYACSADGRYAAAGMLEGRSAVAKVFNNLTGKVCFSKSVPILAEDEPNKFSNAEGFLRMWAPTWTSNSKTVIFALTRTRRAYEHYAQRGRESEGLFMVQTESWEATPLAIPAIYRGLVVCVPDCCRMFVPHAPSSISGKDPDGVHAPYDDQPFARALPLSLLSFGD